MGSFLLGVAVCLGLVVNRQVSGTKKGPGLPGALLSCGELLADHSTTPVTKSIGLLVLSSPYSKMPMVAFEGLPVLFRSTGPETPS